MVSYNVENLFSPWRDSLNPDEAFTPNGEKRWTSRRLRTKCLRIADAIASIGAARQPAIIGLCEVEDDGALHYLLRKTYLNAANYCVYHRDSQDPRGIDVALLYDTAQLLGVGCSWFTPRMPRAAPWLSREILYARFRLPNGDTLHIFQNHWPSKYSGASVSYALRLLAQRALMRRVDSILNVNPNAKILAMGDFNEGAADGLFDAMASPNLERARRRGTLVNLLHPSRRAAGLQGSLKHKGRWAMIDNFFVSPALCHAAGYCVDSAWVHGAKLLLERDAQHGGVRPHRSFLGPRYDAEGTSDHLPIVLRLKIHTFAPKEVCSE